jgi:hypothetical protein
VQKKASKSLAPPHPESQDDYATAYGTVAGQAKVVSWNVNGINAWINNGGVAVLDKDKPDVVCLQEVKANEPDVAKWTKALGNWPHVYFSCCSTQKGYAGTAVLSRVKPLSVHYGLDDDGKHEPEGRVILVEFAAFGDTVVGRVDGLRGLALGQRGLDGFDCVGFKRQRNIALSGGDACLHFGNGLCRSLRNRVGTCGGDSVLHDWQGDHRRMVVRNGGVILQTVGSHRVTLLH